MSVISESDLVVYPETASSSSNIVVPNKRRGTRGGPEEVIAPGTEDRNEPDIVLASETEDGYRIRDEQNQIHEVPKEEVQEALEDPESAYEAGKEWIEPVFEMFRDQLKETILDGTKEENIESAYKAGSTWAKGRFEPVLYPMASKVATDPEYSDLAGCAWGRSRFNPVDEMLADAVSRSPKESSHAGRYWKDRRFWSFAEQFAETAAEDAKASYQAGMHWDEDRFNEFADQFFEAIKETEYGEKVKRGSHSWDKERADRFKENY